MPRKELNAKEATAGMFPKKDEKKAPEKKIVHTEKEENEPQTFILEREEKELPKKPSKKAAKKAPVEPEQKRETYPFSVRLPLETIDKIKAFSKAQNEEVGKVTEAAISDYIDARIKTLSKEQKAVYNSYADLLKMQRAAKGL